MTPADCAGHMTGPEHHAHAEHLIADAADELERQAGGREPEDAQAAIVLSSLLTSRALVHAQLAANDLAARALLGAGEWNTVTARAWGSTVGLEQ